jgi:hypothetical protein
MKSGNRNFLEPSGPLQACNGTALPLPFLICSDADLCFSWCGMNRSDYVCVSCYMIVTCVACFSSKDGWSQLVALSTSVMLGWERAHFDHLRCNYVKASTKIHLSGVFFRAPMFSLLKEVKLADKLILPSSLWLPPLPPLEVLKLYPVLQ